MAFRESILAISPPWLQGFVGSRLQYTSGIGLDSIAQWSLEGVKAALPGIGTPDALYLIGRDRNIDRGPKETDAAYATRLSAAFDTWSTAGSPTTLLQQLLAYFSPSTSTPLRLVTNQGADITAQTSTWHTINLSTGVVTKTLVSPGNWTWDAFTTTRWYRGWVIIDSTSAPWTADLWSSTDSSTWGDGGTWGSSASLAEVAQILSVVDKWRPANVSVPSVIVTFSSTLFTSSAASPPNPSGTSDTPAWRNGVNAIFWGPI